MKGLVWFRRDLRLSDNPALSAACQECREIVPLFVFDEPLLRSHVVRLSLRRVHAGVSGGVAPVSGPARCVPRLADGRSG
jgi:deoxyribodipyrimidine photolyase